MHNVSASKGALMSLRGTMAFLDGPLQKSRSGAMQLCFNCPDVAMVCPYPARVTSSSSTLAVVRCCGDVLGGE
ncbi:hypothetical protein VPH35_014147 [Triticum aestivum]